MRGPFIAAVALGVCAFAAVLAAQDGTKGGQWRSYSGDAGSTKYAPLDQINKDNVRNLRILWGRPDVDPTLTAKSPELRVAPNFRATPLMINGVLYAHNGVGLAEAFDASTGKTRWVQEPFEPNELEGDSTRGVAYWTDGRDERILVQRGEYLYALNAKTGKGYAGFGERGRVNLTNGLGPLMTRYYWTGAPLVIRDVVVIGASMTDSPGPKDQPRGDVRAFDVHTGALRWQFHVIPQAGEFGVNTWENDSWKYSGQAPVWALFSADEELGYVYMPVTSPTSDMYGGHRPGDNLFGQSLVCVKADSGERVWHFQLTHHDLWDFDPPAAPILADIRVDGRSIKAVVQVTKQGFAYVFDRVTGKPVWPIEERPVPQNGVKSEWTSRTQPFPTKPAAFDRVGITTDDLIDFTPELRNAAIDALKAYRLGPVYTPASLMEAPDGTKGTIMLPGNRGGSNWNAGAVDPDTGFVYVPSITRPTLLQLIKDPQSTLDLVATALAPPLPTVDGLPFIKPPYGRITAYDMNKGEIAWQIANGDTPPAIRNHPKLAGVKLPRTGSPSHAGVLATKTLLFAGDGDGGLPMVRALDKKTGEIIWETEVLQGAQTGLPMTYLYRGKQYIVFAAGGGAGRTAQLVAFALPDVTQTR